MYQMNKDLPYEQQMKVLLHYYDKVVEENEALRARIKELEEEKVKYGDPKELHDQLKALPPSVKQLRHVADERKSPTQLGGEGTDQASSPEGSEDSSIDDGDAGCQDDYRRIECQERN